MTCIVGVEHQGHVYIGGDAAASDGDHIISVVDPKVFHVKDIMIGFCGSFRIGQILKYELEKPDHKNDVNDMKYLVVDVIDAIKSLLIAKNIIKKENEVEEMDETSLLIGYRGKLYYMDADFHLNAVKNGYYAIGSGNTVALGSLHTTSQYDFEPVERVKLALNAAVAFKPNVSRPLTIINSENKKKITVK